MTGCTTKLWRYFLPIHSSALASMRYFGVRANSLCWLNSASNTARVLLTASPMPIDIRNGRYFALVSQSRCSSRWQTM
ncbi:hypothetical protein D3C83_100490 [compost metagenome]